jgi:ATP-binding cassette subfamily B protein
LQPLPSASTDPGAPSRRTARAQLAHLGRALAFAADEWRVISVIIGLTVGVGAISAIDPLLVRSLVDGVVEHAPAHRFWTVVLALLGALLVREGLSGLSNWLTWRTRLRVQYRILDATVERLHSLSAAYHQREPVGSTMARLDRGIQGLVSAFSELAFNVVPALVFLALSLGMMAHLEWRLLLVMLALIPLPAFVGAWAAPTQTDRDRTLLDRWGRIYARFNEVLSGILTVRSFAMEHAERRRFMSQVDEANHVVVRGVRFDASVIGVQQALTVLTRVAVIGYGGVLALRGEISIGTWLAFLGYLAGLFAPVQGLTGIYQTLHRASVSLDVVFSVLDSDQRIVDAPGARVVTQVTGAVVFEEVDFAYAGGPPVLHRISFQVAPGKMIGLVGPSGGGKTSLVALLQRLYEPCRGRIRIDGVDVRELQGASLRRQIGVVMQDAVLFNETVRANIAYGRPEASLREIQEAARAANAHEFIQRLPRGYDTEVGDRGGRLSAGQRQRIAIARALLKKPAIVVLDEATSALDAESEALVQEALHRLLEDRTTFVIAHRLTTVVHADQILVLRDGRITESGTHDELLEASGYYASLVRLQARGLARRPIAAM